MSNQNSASHWCKTVIEQTVPPPPPPVFNQQGIIPSKLPVNNPPSVPSTPTYGTSSQLSPQYLQLYNQLYAPQVDTNRSYASVVSQQPQQSQSAMTGMSRPISAPWGNVYSMASAPSYPLQAAPITAPVTLGQAIQQKKPNKSRFTSLVPETSTTTTPYGLTASRTAPAIATTTSTTSNLSPQPDNLKAFVVRAFGSCTSAAHREFISNVLKDKIAKVTAQGQLHSYRWDLEPVPIYDPSTTTSTTITPTSTLSSTIIHSSKNIPISYSSTTTPFSPYINPNSTTTTFTTTTASSTTESKKDKKRKSRTIDTTTSTTTNNITSTVFEGAAKLNTPQEIKMREQRANRFQNDTNTTTTITTTTNHNDNKRNKRTKHNPNSSKIALLMSNSSNNVTNNIDNEINYENLKIIGTCTKLEKDYLRLTSAPQPNIVRPEYILKKTIQLIKKKWVDDTVDYVYMCSQLKSIRQDLTVQHIQNDFTVHVYETHARVALESNDMNEYNQCQTQLKQLYLAGHKGNEMEFTAYRVLYYVYLQGNKKYTAGSMDLAHLMSSLSAEAYRDEAVSHALQIRQALQLDNYHKFFQLYRTTPNMGAYILDLMIDNYRVQSLQKMCRAYKPDVSASFVLQELAFTDDSIGYDFLKKVGCILTNTTTNNSNNDNITIKEKKNENKKEKKEFIWNTKDSNVDLSALLNETKLLL